MKIDITREPPTDIFQNRGRYRLAAMALFALSVCGLLLGAYAIFSDTPYSKKLEMTAFALFVGPAMGFSFFGEKLQAYKRLTPEQKKDLSDLGRNHPEIMTYCGLVAKACRQPILAEYEACQGWSENAEEASRQS